MIAFCEYQGRLIYPNFQQKFYLRQQFATGYLRYLNLLGARHALIQMIYGQISLLVFIVKRVATEMNQPILNYFFLWPSQQFLLQLES
ncbi:hypothetical protein FGO68_gene1578 [Halteria grandinella]|uniref:Uncharacterized protein n=1 Tax=Halteria grandinella TaxID=5974 RepID=A0A8J8P7A9_HALGN|nr:hypothetical protein FGO68_gene1578 [Halteria grandinella]